MSAAEDSRWMRVVLGLARRGLGRVAPNPAVGALILREGRVLGRGVTGDGGRPHAETRAIAEARHRYGADAVRGATAYVTLEPCDHHGRTPPCSDALISAGIARLVCPHGDPDPRVSGRGFARLRAAGVEVTIGTLAEDAAALNAGFLSRLMRGRPLVTLKLAATLDGRIATAAGESRWITGAAARRQVHAMRAVTDAVMIGAGTARSDDPMLDVRGLGHDLHQPVRVVADGSLSLPLTGRLVSTAREVPVWALHAPGAPSDRVSALNAAGVRTIAVAALPDGRISMATALAHLAEAGLTRVLVEGGARLAAALVAERLADRIALFGAGRAIGAEGFPAIAGLGLGRLADAPGFGLLSIDRCGDDIVSHWQRETDGRGDLLDLAVAALPA